MEDDTEKYGANNSHGENAAIRKVGVQHNDCKHDACKSPGTKQDDKELALGVDSQTGKRKEHG